MKITIKQLRNIIKEEVSAAASFPMHTDLGSLDNDEIAAELRFRYNRKVEQVKDGEGNVTFYVDGSPFTREQALKKLYGRAK